MKSTILFAIILAFTTPSFAEEFSIYKISNSNETAPPSLVDKTFKKKIHKGDSEISPDAALGYSSFSGVILDANIAYRYFFWDKVALGGILGGGFSDSYKSARLGVTGRYYFYESGQWAYSFTQDIIHNRYSWDHSFPGIPTTGNNTIGSSALGAHYFFNPNVALQISLNYQYDLIENGTPDGGALTSSIGLNFNF